MKDTNNVKERLVNEVVEVHPGVFVLPLNGSRDSQGMQQLAEQLRGRIERTNASVAIVDMTSVAGSDTKMAHRLVDSINSVRLQGAKVILAGVQPPIVQALVHMGVDLSEVLTYTSLVAGLWAALDIVESRAASKTHTAKNVTRGE